MIKKEELRKNIWSTIRGVRVTKHALDEIEKVYGKAKAENFYELFSSEEEIAYQFLGKGFDKLIVEKYDLAVDEFPKMVNLFAVNMIENEALFDDEDREKIVQEYAKALLQRIILSGIDLQGQPYPSFMRVADYAQQLERVDKQLKVCEADLFAELLDMHVDSILSVMEVCCLYIDYVEDIERLNEILTWKKVVLTEYVNSFKDIFCDM